MRDAGLGNCYTADEERSTLFTGSAGLDSAKRLLTDYKQGKIQNMTPELWQAKKLVDSTIHPDTGETILLPFRMSAFVLSNLVVTAGMLQPGLGVSHNAHFSYEIES